MKKRSSDDSKIEELLASAKLLKHGPARIALVEEAVARFGIARRAIDLRLPELSPLPTEIAGVAFVSDKARNAIDAVGVAAFADDRAAKRLARIFVGAIREPAPALRTRVDIEILR